MSDGIEKALLGEAAGQLPESSAPAGETPESDLSKPLTMADLEKFSADLLAKAEERAERKAQSIADKTASRTDKRIAEANERVDMAVSALKSIGKEPSADEEQAMRQKAVNNALAEKEPASEPASAPEKEQEQASREDPTNLAASNILKAYGVERFDEADPEYAKLLEASKQKDPGVYLQAVVDACKAKSGRLNESPDQAKARVPGLVGGGSGGNSLAGKSTDELFAMAHPPR